LNYSIYKVLNSITLLLQLFCSTNTKLSIIPLILSHQITQIGHNFVCLIDILVFIYACRIRKALRNWLWIYVSNTIDLVLRIFQEESTSAIGLLANVFYFISAIIICIAVFKEYRQAFQKSGQNNLK
jgi:hypothetical protein